MLLAYYNCATGNSKADNSSSSLKTYVVRSPHADWNNIYNLIAVRIKLFVDLCELCSKAIEINIPLGTMFLYLGSESPSISFVFPESGIERSRLQFACHKSSGRRLTLSTW